MRKAFTEKLKNSSGFTLAEMLITVAIMVILLSMSGVGISKMSREMNMTRLDDSARQIYIEAQSQLVYLKNSGEIGRINEASAEASLEPGNDEEEGVLFIGSDNALVKDLLLPSGTVEGVIRSQNYIIEYNPDTAMIHGVFFWEDGESFGNSDYKALISRARSNRTGRNGAQAGPVGYYEGGNVTRQESTESAPLTLRVVNGEKLYLEIAPAEIKNSLLAGEVLVEVRSSSDANALATVKFANNSTISVNTDDDNLTYNRETGCYELLFDSLVSGKRFYDLYSKKYSAGWFAPGCDLNVTVSFSEKGKTPAVQVIPAFNSLFENVDGETAYISCGRHLQNLHVCWSDNSKVIGSGNSYGQSSAGSLCGVTAAVQTADISWNSKDFRFQPIQNTRLSSYDGAEYTITGLNIEGHNVLQKVLLWDAADNRAAGLFGFFCGSSLKNIRLVNCYVNNPLTYSGDVPTHSGLLAGFIWKNNGTVTIENCHAYASGSGKCYVSLTDLPSKNSAFGGLIGGIKSTVNPKGSSGFCIIRDCSASISNLNTIDQGSYIGGLVGYAEHVSIEHCYANVGVRTSSGWSGGIPIAKMGNLLGGYAKNNSITDSYACGFNPSSGGHALAGDPASWDIANSSLTITNSYGAVVAPSSTSGEYIPIGTLAASSNVNCENCYLLAEKSDASASSGIRKLSYSDLSKLVINAQFEKPVVTYPYGLKDEKYPFAGLSNFPHYGDWPEAEANNLEMAYYEVYKDASGNFSIGFYNSALDMTGTSSGFVSDPKSKGLEIVQDGYCVFFQMNTAKHFNYIAHKDLTSASKVKCTWTTGKTKYTDKNQFVTSDAFTYNGNAIEVSYLGKALKNPGNSVALVTIKGKQYKPLFLSMDQVVNAGGADASSGSYFVSFKVTAGSDTTEFWFNPLFAKSKIGKNSKPSVSGTFIGAIRTNRQFATLASSGAATENPATSNRYYRAGMNFVQEQDLDFSSNFYTSSYFDKSMPAACRTSVVQMDAFAGNYDGKDHFIAGLTLPKGLFDLANSNEKAGSIKNLTLLNCKSTSAESQALLADGLDSGDSLENITIENCTLVNGYDRSGLVAGSVVKASLKNITIKNSSVKGAVIDVGTVAGYLEDSNASGIVLENADASSLEYPTGYGVGGVFGHIVVSSKNSVTIENVSGTVAMPKLLLLGGKGVLAGFTRNGGTINFKNVHLTVTSNNMLSDIKLFHKEALTGGTFNLTDCDYVLNGKLKTVTKPE